MGGLIFIDTSTVDGKARLSERNELGECLAVQAARFLYEAKGLDVVVLDVGSITVFADYFVIASGSSSRHVRSLADKLLYSEHKIRKPAHVEGYQMGSWVLLDYGDVVVHIFGESERHFYGLERLWGDAPEIGFKENEE